MTPECKPSVWTWTDSEPFWNLSSLFFLETLSAPFSNDIWAIIPAAAKSLQSCQTLCNPIDGSPPGSPVSGILKARKLEWVAISFSDTQKGKVKEKSLSCVWLLATPWIVAHQAPPSMGFSRQEYWSGVPLPSPPIIPGKLLLEKKKAMLFSYFLLKHIDSSWHTFID